MSRFRRLSQTTWHCEYHLVWVPKYRYRLMPGKNKEEVELCVGEQTRQMNCGEQELNAEADPLPLIVQMSQKLSIWDNMGRLKGKSPIGVFSPIRDLRQRRYWGNHFWGRANCVGTVGLDGERIRKYVKWQEKQEQKRDEFRFSK